MSSRAAGAPREARDAIPLQLFRPAAALALLLHAWLALGRQGLVGGGDLVPHLRLMRAMQEAPGLHNTYAQAYHVLGALLLPAMGPELFTAGFALLGALLLILGFRSLQRAVGLPEAGAAIFALTPYLLSLSWCTPRVEAWGYGLLVFGLAAQLRGRRLALALLLAACFLVHTASALLFGLAAGALALLRRNAGDLLALAAGSLLASPLLAAHLAAGCSLAEGLLFSAGGYSRSLAEPLLPPNAAWILPLANPLALLAGAAGSRALARHYSALALVCAILVALYLNNFWLAPLGVRTLVTPLRGLSLLAIPVALAAAALCAERPLLAPWLVGLSALWALSAPAWLMGHACFVRPISPAEAESVEVDRCSFRWWPARPGPAGSAALAPAPPARLNPPHPP